MSNNWQQPPQNNHSAGNNPPSQQKPGGLLSNYGNERSPAPQSPPGRPGAQPPVPAGPVYPQHYQPAPGPQGPGARPVLPQALVSNTMQMMRRWSGKLASVAGYQAQPPAPHLDRYRSPSSPAWEQPVAHPRRWKRSRVLRVTMQMRHRRERWLRAHPQLGTVFGALLIVLAMVIMMGSVGGSAYGYSYYQGQLPRLENIAQQTMAQTSRIFDRNGAPLFEMYETSEEKRDRGRRTPVTYDDIPKVLQDAVVAIEDDTFWENAGVSPIGILRAVISYVQGGDRQGASTIAQQVIKNMTGEDDVNMARKVSEAALAIGLTQQYPKWKIMEMYMNVAPFGPMDLGAEAAAEEYFHLKRQCTDMKSGQFTCTPGLKYLDKILDGCEINGLETCKSDPLLGLARASLLAGLPQNPRILYPAGGEQTKQNALFRQSLVLSRMVELKMNVEGLGVITPAIAQQASDMTAQMQFTPYEPFKRAPHFVDWVIDKVAIELGNGDVTAGYQAFITGGFNIRTTISAELQDFVERSTQHHLTAEPSLNTKDFLPLNTGHNVNSSASVVMNSHTGEILAMNGSADYYNDDVRVGGQYNAADPPPNADGTHSGRPPGSSFKPFVYAAAFEMGWYPGMVIPDFHTYFPNAGQGPGTPAPKTEEEAQNADFLYAPPDFSFEGHWNFTMGKAPDGNDSTVRLALQESQNVGAVKAMKYAGPENVQNMVERLGITQIQRGDIAWALGTENVSVLQMTSAYQTFANGGKRIPPQGILDIWDNYGRSLYHYDPANPPAQQVVSPQVAFMLTSVLTDERSRLREFGSYHTLSLYDMDRNCISASVMEQCGYQVASKTGTTDELKDNWTVGYTPNVVVGTWAGNADNTSMINVLGISGAGPIWHSIIKAANGYCGQGEVIYEAGIECPPPDIAQKLGISQDTQFTPPAGVSRASTSAINGLAGSGHNDWMIDGQQPQQAGVVPGR